MKRKTSLCMSMVLAMAAITSGLTLGVQADFADVIDAVDDVRNGYLGTYDAVTIAEVLEYSLPGGTWDGEEDGYGVITVEYETDAVEIEFSVTLGEETFTVSNLEKDGNEGLGVYAIKDYLDGLYALYVEEYPESGLTIDESSENNTLRGTFATEYSAPDSDEEVYILGDDIGDETSGDIDSAEEADWDYEALYGIVLDSAEEFSTYILYDIDADGTKELVVSYGSTADYTNDVWTVNSSGERTFIGKFYLPQTFYTAPDYNGIYGVYSHMNYEIVTRITLLDGEIVEEEISEGEVVDYYSNDMPITSYDVSDRSGFTDVLEGSEASADQSSQVMEDINIYGTYYYDNGSDNTMTAEIGFNTDEDEGDYIYIEAWSYGDRLTLSFTGELVDMGNYVYRAIPYDDYFDCELEVVISSDGMTVTVPEYSSESWLVLAGVYEKTATLDLYGVS